jgi:UDP-glucose 4-epimerase
VGESVAKPLDYYRNNLNSIINLLEFCKERSINNFIFSSTAAVYGNSGKSKVSEDDPVNPENPYGWSKLMSEQIIKDANKSYGINAVILRYFNVAGNVKDAIIGDLQPNPQNLIPAMIMSHLGLRPINLKVFGNDYPTRDGTGVRDYIHVLDLVEGHLKALDYLQSNSGVNTFNLGTGNGATVLEVIKTFEEVTGEKLNYEIVERRPGDPAEVLTETEKSKNILNWEAKYSLREMVESMVV